MSNILRFDSYDPFAWFYDTYFDFHEQSLFIIDKLLKGKLQKGDRILDLGCGTGHLAEALVSRGFVVVGIDGSAEMLSRAKKKVPEGEFVLADARNFTILSRFSAVFSTFDCINHIMNREDLILVFRNVFDSLEKDGYFLFDLNMEEAFQTQWNKSATIVKDDNACIIKGSYDPENKTGITNLTLFFLEGAWRRTDVTLYQRCYSPEEVVRALKGVGFHEISLFDARRELKMEGHLAIGRNVFLARR